MGMRHHILALGLLLGRLAPLSAQFRVPEVYTVDQAHSLLDFTTRLVGFNRVRGTFGTWQADFVYDPAAPLSGFVSFIAEASSIATQVEERDQDLKGANFFDVARFPLLRFEGHVGSVAGTTLQIEGKLTIRDSTRTLRFPLELVTSEATDPFGNRRLVFAGKVTLNRRDFGVVGPKFWNRAISDSVSIEMELAGRIWGYTSRGFRHGAYYGPGLVAAADSNRFPEVSRRMERELAAEQDSVRFPSPGETDVAVGRLIQAGKPREALTVLELFDGTVDKRWAAPARSFYEARLGEVLIRLGRGEEARRHLDKAIALDSSNTNARAWRASAPK
jgi:polyisoprenoid-binding protein YceI